MTEAGDALDWQVRTFVYRVFAARGTPPSADQIGAAFGLSAPEARTILERLHRARALVLDPEDRSIRMAKPFSAVPTGFHVSANGRTWWANCALDALGIPAALHADARIEARCAASGHLAVIEVVDGQVHGNGEVAHFPLPFHRWFDDVIGT